jgi:glycosyltransferase involved in cell wall biosynthesis
MLANAESIHTVRWANAIAANKGYEVHLVSRRPPLEKIRADVRVWVAPWPTSLGYFLNAPFVRGVIRTIRPTLVHAHYASGYGTLGRLAGFHPLVLSVWGADVYDFPRKSAIHRWLIQRNLASADRVLSTSRVMTVETHKYTQKEIDVTPFGVDLDQFEPRAEASGFGRENIVIGTIKTLDSKYGIEFLIRAFKLVKDKHPKLPLKMLIVGTGPDQSRLKKLAVVLGVMQDTVFAGHIEHSEVPRYHNMLSVSVFLSVKHSESFGVAVIEASACGKPVVVANVGGLPEVVEDGVTGFVVEPRNAKQTANAIEKLVLDESLRRRMGECGKRRVERLYNWAESVNKVLRIYREVIDGYLANDGAWQKK